MKNLRYYSLLIALLLLGHTSCKQDDIEINNTDEFEEFVSEEMSTQHIPAAAVLIFNGETILYEKYFGEANIQQNTALTSNHLFLIASISKVVTATALLQLYDEGKFNLDDPINDYLPFKVNIPGYTDAVTFKMLLTHTSAIADNDPVLDGHYFYNQDPTVSLFYFMENYFSTSGEYYSSSENFHDFAPGTVHEYSNVGSALIGVLVEEISGEGFNAYCKKNIFGPLGMQNTSWRLDEITQPIATPYDYIGGQNNAIQNYTNTDYPNGGLRTTAKDLHILAATLSNKGQYGAAQLLKPATAEAMMTPQIPTIDSEVGLHFFVMNSQYGLWGHDGGEQGVATIMGFNPNSKIGAIILTNQGEADLDDMLSGAYQLGEKL